MNLKRPIRLLAAIAGPLLVGAGPAAGQCEPPPPVKLKAPDPQPNQLFGRAVAISGDLMAVGAPRDGQAGQDAGAVYMYALQDGAWMLQKKILAPGGQGGKPGNNFGWAVDLKGQLLVAGTPGLDGNTGAAYVFRQEAGVWKQEKAILGAAGPDSYFGQSVAVDTDAPDALIVVGEPKFSGIGAAYLYRRGQGDWLPEATLAALDGHANERFGESVDVEGDVAVVGAYHHVVNNMYLGAVYVFRAGGPGWAQEQELLAPDGFAWQGFGLGVSLSLPLLIVGTESYDENMDMQLRGAAYIFTDSEAGWQEEVKFESPAGLDDDAFGSAVDLRGGLALVGAIGDLAAYSFTWTGPGQWQLLQTFRPDDPKSLSFASDVALGADMAVFGDPVNDYQDGGALGAVFVSDLCSPPCYADFDGDGGLTIFDFLSFVNTFNGGDAHADCYQNGQWNLFDFLCFVDAFNQGCG